MSTINDAAEIIAESITRDSAPAHEIVADLEHDGLLMPDLPEPQVVPTGMEDRVYLSWRGDPVDVERSARITELFTPGASFPILSLDADEARCLGLRLLAAADHAERNQE